MFDANVRVHHAEIETEPITSRIRHAYIRTALEHFGLFRGVEAVLTSDVMTTGSGLGASSSTMSALVKGCSLLRTDNVVEDKHKLAELTYQLEQSAGTIGGKQDQYAVAFGGLNSIVFHEKEVTVSPVKISRSRLKEFEERLFLVFTNLARDSRNIQINLEQNVKTNDRKKHFDSLQNLSHEFLNIIESEHGDLNDLGKLLHEGWMLKKSTNRESTNPYIEQLYDTLMAKGILGGKILGAGGGGFILAFVSDPGLKEKIKYELYPNFIALDVKFNFKGTEVLWKNF
jgi:D-glycero-alpha-D-manno-heptose-7-phosphate kinase